MRLKLHPRFFIFALILLGSGVGVFLYCRPQKDSSGKKEVLSASNKYELIEQKNNTDTTLVAGREQVSDIASYEPITIAHTVKEGDTLQSIAAKYHADAQTIADFPNNGLKDSLQLEVGQVLIIPNGYIDESQKPPPPPIAQGTGQFSWPAIGEITQYAYSWHPGALDIAVPLRTEVRAADDGTVKTVEYLTTGYGIHVIIDHGGGLTSLYGHLSETKVTQGQGIRKGDLIGLSGSTGHSTGPHLHFEVRRGTTPVDPMTLLPPR